MTDVTLQVSTNVSQVDRILQGIVGLYEQVFSGYIRSYYVIGSYSDSSMVSSSDIDLVIVFAKPLTHEQLRQAFSLAGHCSLISPIRLDIELELEQNLADINRVILKLGSALIYGEDIRETFTLPPIEAYQRDVTWSPYRFFGQVIRDQEILTYPLNYPDPQAPFYGYTRKRIASWYPDTVEQGTKELITAVTRTATALLALEAHQYVGTKGASIKSYRAHIDDEWAEYIETLYQKGKVEWQYAIPDAAADQQLLRSLCQRTLAFENFYFQRYRLYLLALLQGEGESQQFAAERLTQTTYTDDEIIAALQYIERSSKTQEARDQAMQALENIRLVQT